MDGIDRELGERIRAERLRRGWCLDVASLYRLAGALGCDPRELLPPARTAPVDRSGLTGAVKRLSGVSGRDDLASA